MESATRKKFQIVFLIIFAILLIRIGLIWKERREAAEEKPGPVAAAIPNDAYVVPPKLHAYDLASAKKGLEGKTIWVAAGDQISFYPVHGGVIDWKHAAGALPPLDALQIQKIAKVDGPVELIKQGDVVFHKTTPHIVAFFQRQQRKEPPETYAAEIGTVSGNSYRFTVDDVFFLEDPHHLYKWPAETWQAIDQHQAVKGMNELQTSLALGPGKAVEGTGNGYGDRTLQYQSGGKTVTVTFLHDRATNIQSTT